MAEAEKQKPRTHHSWPSLSALLRQPTPFFRSPRSVFCFGESYCPVPCRFSDRQPTYKTALFQRPECVQSCGGLVEVGCMNSIYPQMMGKLGHTKETHLVITLSLFVQTEKSSVGLEDSVFLLIQERRGDKRVQFILRTCFLWQVRVCLLARTRRAFTCSATTVIVERGSMRDCRTSTSTHLGWTAPDIHMWGRTTVSGRVPCRR